MDSNKINSNRTVNKLACLKISDLSEFPLYAEQDLLPISALQHFLFCERQWGLIHLEKIWSDNHLTMEGNQLHERVDNPECKFRGNVKVVRSLRLRSLKLGLTGTADIVEFHRNNDVWQPYPIEYKRGKPKKDLTDAVQLCAQALCLEEMLGCNISKGSFFYGEHKRRFEIDIDEILRNKTKKLILRLHKATKDQKTPSAVFEQKCHSCSLFNVCLPVCTNGLKSGVDYVKKILLSIERELKT